MKPDQVATELIRVANQLKASKNPDRQLVVSDLKSIMASLVRISNSEWVAVQISKSGVEADYTDLSPGGKVVFDTRLPNGDRLIIAKKEVFQNFISNPKSIGIDFTSQEYLSISEALESAGIKGESKGEYHYDRDLDLGPF